MNKHSSSRSNSVSFGGEDLLDDKREDIDRLIMMVKLFDIQSKVKSSYLASIDRQSIYPTKSESRMEKVFGSTYKLLRKRFTVTRRFYRRIVSKLRRKPASLHLFELATIDSQVN